jgi:Protein of unknown function (DUF3168)
MSYPSHALRSAMVSELRNSTALTTLLGGPKIYDEPPANASFPYISCGDWMVRDFSTDGTRAHEHTITLHVYSKQGGRLECEEITAELLQLLDDMPLSPPNHHLVNMRFTFADMRREADGRTYHAVVRFRAVTEPL